MKKWIDDSRQSIVFEKELEIFNPLENEQEYVSYDAESLFTNIPLKETVNYILLQIYQIYVQKVLPQICSRLIDLSSRHY